jgi:hypothetical protein
VDRILKTLQDSRRINITVLRQDVFPRTVIFLRQEKKEKCPSLFAILNDAFLRVSWEKSLPTAFHTEHIRMGQRVIRLREEFGFHKYVDLLFQLPLNFDEITVATL